MGRLCSKCGIQERRSDTSWCNECMRRSSLAYARAKREANPRKCRDCENLIPAGEQWRLCAGCRAPKPILVPMTCEDCGVVEMGPRNKKRCRACAKQWQKEREKSRGARNAQRNEQRFNARNPEGKFCPCGGELSARKHDLCDACQETTRQDNQRRKDGYRRARKRACPRGAVSIRALWAAFSGKCPLCRRKVTRANGHVDHIIPLAKGGAHSQENLQILCGPCNVAKGAAVPSGQFRLL